MCLRNDAAVLVGRGRGGVTRPMGEHPNATLVRRLFEAFHDRDLPAIVAAVGDDVVWHFPGHQGKLAGTHRGRDAVLGFLGMVGALTDGTFHLELEDVTASDRHAVALFRGQVRATARRSTTPPACACGSRTGGSSRSASSSGTCSPSTTSGPERRRAVPAGMRPTT